MCWTYVVVCSPDVYVMWLRSSVVCTELLWFVRYRVPVVRAPGVYVVVSFFQGGTLFCHYLEHLLWWLRYRVCGGPAEDDGV